MHALINSTEGRETWETWVPPDSGILDLIEELHAQYPDGFQNKHWFNLPGSSVGKKEP